MAFYRPFICEFIDKPIICYVDDSASALFKANFDERFLKAGIESLLSALSNIGPLPKDTDYILAFFWRSTNRPAELISDFWIQRQLGTYGTSAPRTDLRVFLQNGREIPTDIYGNASGDTRIVSGREEEHRRLITSKGGSLADYLTGDRPKMPEGLIIPCPG